ncbi:response regulator [Yinghuangia sp. YIM S09857]|uniref:response regulator n=1 Tax=Yinghuangia sp. YIM S09857 TaxID=3436929 RepID=UPI003F535930
MAATGAPLTVVLVDDHEGFRRLATRLLTSWGYRVVGEAADGPGAVEAARRLRPDLVLLDVQLPGYDGFTAADRIRADDAGVGIVLISGRARDDYGDRIPGAHADGYISKEELSPQTLAATLRTSGTRHALGTAPWHTPGTGPRHTPGTGPPRASGTGSRPASEAGPQPTADPPPADTP